MTDLSRFFPEPEYIDDAYKGAGKLTGKRALISGGDSGIGRRRGASFRARGGEGGDPLPQRRGQGRGDPPRA